MLVQLAKCGIALVLVAGCGAPEKDDDGAKAAKPSGSSAPSGSTTETGSAPTVAPPLEADTQASASGTAKGTGTQTATDPGSAAGSGTGSGTKPGSSSEEEEDGSEITELPPPDETPASADDPAAFRYGALGDSITRAFNAITPFAEDLPISFATGTALLAQNASHYARLRQVLKLPKVAVANEAVVGAHASGLESQVDALVAFKPDYATLLIGANDLCQGPADAEAIAAYGDAVATAIDRLVAANAKVRVVLLGIPDVARLYDVMKDDADCRSTWSLLPLCPNLLASDLTDADRVAFRARWQQMNDKLKTTATARAANVRFAEAVATSVFEKSHVSKLDCFHPSVAGHANLAAKSFDEAFAKEAVAAKAASD